jgi:hypothetical protein
LVKHYAAGKGAANNDKNRRLAEKSSEKLRSIMKDGAERGRMMESGSL